MTVLFTVEIDILLIQLRARQFYRFDPRSMKLILRIPIHTSGRDRMAANKTEIFSV